MRLVGIPYQYLPVVEHKWVGVGYWTNAYSVVYQLGSLYFISVKKSLKFYGYVSA